MEKKYGEKRILNKYLNDPVLQARKNWKEKFLRKLNNVSPYSSEIQNLQIYYEVVERNLSYLNKFNILYVEPGSETDFLVMCNRLDLISSLVRIISKKFKYKCLLGCHHA